jgi:multidrug resistance efflux pump
MPPCWWAGARRQAQGRPLAGREGPRQHAHHWRHLVGPRHVALKLVGADRALALAFFSIVDGDYMITADASLEGKVQRAVTAAMQGYIVEARARAGDIVREGDVLAAMDTRDLRLERQKVLSQGAQQESERRQAIAEGNRARAAILEAQSGQVRAQLTLIDEQISRAQLVAPFDAVVVKGDLSQSLGAAVERGNVLFELAPLDTYRVIMKVDERDITASRSASQAASRWPACPTRNSS